MTSRSVLSSLTVVVLLTAVSALSAAPTIVNPSFEVDHYGRFPGLAVNNGGITGWKFTGNVGINPWWKDLPNLREPQNSFSDNGRVPDGHQVALMQNICRLSQMIHGLKAGRHYVIEYFENSRHNNASGKNAILTVTLGGETIVSPHTLLPVDAFDHYDLPYNRVVSAPFVPAKDGDYELVFSTLLGDRVTALIDKVTIREQ